MNSGVITALFATYCIFVSVFMRIIFNEKLKLKFFAGIGCMLICVGFISYSALTKDTGESEKEEGLNQNAVLALSFGIGAPFMISIMITLSRYWT